MPRSVSFRSIEYPVVGDSYVSSAKDLSQAYTKNMYATSAPDGIKPTALLSWPGLKVWSSGAAGEKDRGIYKQLFNNLGWKVSGTTLYSFNSAGVQTSQGTIAGTELVSFADNGSTLLICNGSTLYAHNSSSLSTLSLTFTPVMVDILNNQFIAMDNTNSVYISDVGTTTFNALNVYSPESSSDKLTAIKVYNQFVFNMGERTIEPWENTGSGTPPFARMNGAIIEDVGVASRFAIDETTEALYFLGSDKIPYRVINFQAQSIADGNLAISELFQTYTRESAWVQVVTIDGQDFALYGFPANNKVWAYSQQTGLWIELDHDVNKQMYLGCTISRLFNKNLVGDRTNGNIYELDSSTYQNNSAPMVRERVFRPLAGEVFGRSRTRFQMKVMRFAVETGVGVNDDNPQMIISYSIDGNRNFGSERWLSLGENGDYLETVEDYQNKKFKDLAVKVRYTENTRFSLYSSSIDIREAGR